MGFLLLVLSSSLYAADLKPCVSQELLARKGFSGDFTICWTNTTNHSVVVETFKVITNPKLYDPQYGSGSPIIGVLLDPQAEKKAILVHQGNLYLLLNPMAEAKRVQKAIDSGLKLADTLWEKCSDQIDRTARSNSWKIIEKNKETDRCTLMSANVSRIRTSDESARNDEGDASNDFGLVFSEELENEIRHIMDGLTDGLADLMKTETWQMEPSGADKALKDDDQADALARELADSKTQSIKVSDARKTLKNDLKQHPIDRQDTFCWFCYDNQKQRYDPSGNCAFIIKEQRESLGPRLDQYLSGLMKQSGNECQWPVFYGPGNRPIFDSPFDASADDNP